MTPDPTQALKDFQAEKDYFIGIDSDGCAFDSMEIKQKECFIPNTCKYFGLQAVSKYAREAGEFVNLYSKWRGQNRFHALVMVMDLLAEREEVVARKVEIPRLPALREWLAKETKLGNPALAAAIQSTSGETARELQLVLDWSLAVNAAVADLVHGLPPFPFVRESLLKAGLQADLMVVSATPAEALQKEWAEHGLDQLVRLIAGQEMGTKTEHLKLATGGKYAVSKVLMVGDAFGDLKAARANQALFYPILPGNEEDSWKRFYQEAMDRFFEGTYAGDYENHLIEEFQQSLPEAPPWKV